MRTLLVLSYMVLNTALMISNGLYNRLALLLVIASFGFLVASARQFYQQHSAESNTSYELVLWFALLFSIGLWFVGPTSTDPHPDWYEDLAQTFAALALAGVMVGYALQRRWPRLVRAMLLALGVLPIILWFLLPSALPVPPIDIYSFHQSAAQYLIRGVNPYSVELGVPTHYSVPVGYPYPPGILYLVGLSVWLAGDVRYGQATAMVATAVFLWLIASRAFRNVSAEVLVLLFFYHPRLIFILDHSFTESALAAPLAFFVFLTAYRWLPALAAVAFGYFISLKPYLVFLPLSWLIVEKRPRYLLLGAAGALVPMIPFLAGDFVGTMRNGFLASLLLAPFRPDSLTLSSLLFEFFGFRAPLAGWSLAIGGLSVVISLFLFYRQASLVGFMFAATIVMFSIFLLGSQAFGGYYYLVTVMLLLLMMVGDDLSASERLSQR